MRTARAFVCHSALHNGVRLLSVRNLCGIDRSLSREARRLDVAGGCEGGKHSPIVAVVGTGQALRNSSI